MRPKIYSELPGCGTVLLAVVFLLALAVTAHPAPLPRHRATNKADKQRIEVFCLRLDKCGAIWRAVAPYSYDPRLVSFWVAEHQRQGIPEEWRASLIYSYSGSDLDPRMVCSGDGMCAVGLCDETEVCYPADQALKRFGTLDRHDCWLAIASHVYQAAGLHASTGREGLDLMRSVFLPMAPDGARAWQEQSGRWEGIAARFDEVLAQAYRTGTLAPPKKNRNRRKPTSLNCAPAKCTMKTTPAPGALAPVPVVTGR